MLLYVAGKLSTDQRSSGQGFRNSYPRYAEASLRFSIGSFRRVRGLTDDVCFCMFAFGDMCQFVRSFMSLHFCCSFIQTR